MTSSRPSRVAARRLRSRARSWAASTRRNAINLAARGRAKRRNPRVSTAVSPAENMLFNGTLRLYFETGESAFAQIAAGLAAAGLDQPTRVLDLPCGYGRVLRYMRAAWPDAEIVAMELLAGAPEFCAEAFGARPARSAEPLWTARGVGEDFDLVWSGSLLTHFDADAWIPTLRYFRDRLRPGGVAIFTTHGERSIRLLARDPDALKVVSEACEGWTGDYLVGDAPAAAMVTRARRSGFAFERYDWDGSAGWGVSVSTAEWVQATAAAAGGLDLVLHRPAGWSEHQDVWTFRRTP
jgi:SAM-dependent methyltransferase